MNQYGETGTAAQRCAALNINGFTDWFLPSRDELNLMHQNLHLAGIGSFGQGNNTEYWQYWSSSQGHFRAAWHQYFECGAQGNASYCQTFRVRAVRAF
jgi:hypothetical protein